MQHADAWLPPALLQQGDTSGSGGSEGCCRAEGEASGSCAPGLASAGPVVVGSCPEAASSSLKRPERPASLEVGVPSSESSSAMDSLEVRACARMQAHARAS